MIDYAAEYGIDMDIAKKILELAKAAEWCVNALSDAEANLAHWEKDLEEAESISFLDATGSVAERQAKSKLSCAGVRFDRDMARVGVNRVRTKMEAINSQLYAQATVAKIVQAGSRETDD
jgi:hypothetical protein